MNITLRKLAMLEKSLLEREKAARMNGYSTNPVDTEFKNNVSELMNRVKTL